MGADTAAVDMAEIAVAVMAVVTTNGPTAVSSYVIFGSVECAAIGSEAAMPVEVKAILGLNRLFKLSTVQIGDIHMGTGAASKEQGFLTRGVNTAVVSAFMAAQTKREFAGLGRAELAAAMAIVGGAA